MNLEQEIKLLLDKVFDLALLANRVKAPHEVAAAVFCAGWLGEIAAQLAELNELLRNVAASVLPLER